MMVDTSRREIDMKTEKFVRVVKRGGAGKKKKKIIKKILKARLSQAACLWLRLLARASSMGAAVTVSSIPCSSGFASIIASHHC